MKMTNIKEKSLYRKTSEAAIAGDLEQLKRLVKQITNPNDYNEALQLSAINGHTECVKLLIPLSDPKKNGSYALRLASEKGHTECVKLLIPVSDPKADNSYALRWASEIGHTECVKLLIPVSDVKTNNSQALRWASESNNNCFELLLPHSDISKWGSGHWENINSDIRNIIRSYYSKISLERSLIENGLPNNNQISKSKKSHKI